MSKIYTTMLTLFFMISAYAVTSSVYADDCVAPVTMSCTYVDDGATIDATVMVNYAVDPSTAMDLSSVVFTGNCDATAVGVGAEAVDPTHDTAALVSNEDGVCDIGGTDLCTDGMVGETCASNEECDTFTNVPDINPCGEGDMKIKAGDYATYCTSNEVSNEDGVCDIGGTDLCTDGMVGETCASNEECDTTSVGSIDCTKLIEDIDVSACDAPIGVIAESSNLHDPSNDNDTNDCNGRKCKKDGDDKGHDRGKVLCTPDLS